MQLWATRRVGCWAIMNSVEFVGVTQFGPTDPHPEFYQPGTFILPEYRGRDVNTILKNATVKAFARMGIPFGAHVRLWNKRSQAAMKKLFPSVEPVVHEHNGEERWWYDLSRLNPGPPTQAEEHIYRHFLKMKSVLLDAQRQALAGENWWNNFVRKH